MDEGNLKKPGRFEEMQISVEVRYSEKREAQCMPALEDTEAGQPPVFKLKCFSKLVRELPMFLYERKVKWLPRLVTVRDPA